MDAAREANGMAQVAMVLSAVGLMLPGCQQMQPKAAQERPSS